MSTRLEIPEWTGSALTIAAFARYAQRTVDVFTVATFQKLALTETGPALTRAVMKLSEAVNRQRAFDETTDVTQADAVRDAIWMALWSAWHYLDGLPQTHALGAAANVLRSEMNAYKGVNRHELQKETEELAGLQRDLMTEANEAALNALGLNKIASALFVANDAVAAAENRREEERGARVAEKTGESTAVLRREVKDLLLEAYRQVNAVARIQGDETVAKVIQDVNGIIEHYKQIAAQPAHRPGQDDPEPQPDPQPAPEPDEDAPAS